MDKDFIERINNEENITNLKNAVLFYYKHLENSLNEVNIYKFILSSINTGCDFDYVENPKVSIIIPVKNEFVLTKFLLNSIKLCTENIPYEVIIADDNSQDETQNIENFFKNVRLIKNNTGINGFLYNVSNAIKYARGEYILLLNNDMLVYDNYLAELLKVIESDNTIGIAGSKNLRMDGTIIECGVNINKNGLIRYIAQDKPQEFYDELSYIDCDYCSGCSILFRKDVWIKSGGFDINYAPAYYEDSDFALNLKYNFNLKSVCVPKSKIIHFKSVSYAKDFEIPLSATKNREYFLNKWGNYFAE